MTELGSGLSIKAAVAWLPPDREGPSGAELSQEDLDRIGVKELTVATELAAPEMAVLAARAALEAGGVEPSDIGYLVHAYM